MAADYELSLNDYLQILRRRYLHLIGAFFLLLCIAIIAAIAIPPVYQSTGTILIESQQIPQEMVQGTITTYADERIEVIRQRAITRENLLRIVEKYKLFTETNERYTASELVDMMRESILIERVNAEQGRNRGSATIAFKVSFEYRNAEIANRVANELVTLFLNENVKSRTERATETTKFMEVESERLRTDLEKIENQVATYKQEHANSLPEHLQVRMTMAQNLDSDLNELDRDYKETQERLRYLDIELSAAKMGYNEKQSAGSIPLTPKSELEKLRIELSKLSVSYSDSHPDIKALKRKIEALEKSEAEAPKPADNKTLDPGPESLMVAKVQAQIDSANERLTSIDQQRKLIKSRQAQLQNEIIRSPQVEHGLSTLLRDYETSKKKYDEVQSKLNSAKIAENLEQENKGERFSLLEPPALPDKPIKPDRKKIIAMGFFLAIAGSVGLIAMLESINPRVRSQDEIIAILGRRPIAVIPYITTQKELSRQKHLTKYFIAAAIAAVLISMAIIHFLLMPLDVLTYKVIGRLS